MYDISTSIYFFSAFLHIPSRNLQFIPWSYIQRRMGLANLFSIRESDGLPNVGFLSSSREAPDNLEQSCTTNALLSGQEDIAFRGVSPKHVYSHVLSADKATNLHDMLSRCVGVYRGKYFFF